MKGRFAQLEEANSYLATALANYQKDHSKSTNNNTFKSNMFKSEVCLQPLSSGEEILD